MALITRFGRLFRADLHAVLDRIEEPDVMLRQAVREMEEEVAADEQRLRQFQLENKQLAARYEELQGSQAQFQEELSVCLDADNDDLARSLLKRKLETEQLLQLIQRRRQQQSQSLTELGTRLQQNRSRLSAMQQKLELFIHDAGQDERDDTFAMPVCCVSDEEVEVALLREKQKRRPS